MEPHSRRLGRRIEMADERMHGDGLFGRFNRAAFSQPDEVGALDVGDRHAGIPRVVAELLRGAVVIGEAVVLPFDVGEFRVDVALNLWIAALLRGEMAETPGDVAVASACRDAAV